jgi:hypothetical protein
MTDKRFAALDTMLGEFGYIATPCSRKIWLVEKTDRGNEHLPVTESELEYLGSATNEADCKRRVLEISTAPLKM